MNILSNLSPSLSQSQHSSTVIEMGAGEDASVVKSYASVRLIQEPWGKARVEDGACNPSAGKAEQAEPGAC